MESKFIPFVRDLMQPVFDLVAYSPAQSAIVIGLAVVVVAVSRFDYNRWGK